MKNHLKKIRKAYLAFITLVGWILILLCLSIILKNMQYKYLIRKTCDEEPLNYEKFTCSLYEETTTMGLMPIKKITIDAAINETNKSEKISCHYSYSGYWSFYSCSFDLKEGKIYNKKLINKTFR